jgi:6-phosphogluconolactonase
LNDKPVEEMMAVSNRPLNLPHWIDWIEHLDRESLALALSQQVAAALLHGIRDHARSTLVVSGGSTPLLFFQALSAQALPWDKVNVTLADERLVPPDHEDSNERLVRENLLIDRAAMARFIPLYPQASDETLETVAHAAALTAEVINQLHQPFDVLVLGMGTDGHTASLFPGSPLLGHALNPECEDACVPMHPVNAPWDRLTLTLPVLAGCRKIFLQLHGADKLKTLALALSSEDEMEMPIRAFLKQPLAIYWSQ